MSQGSAQAEAAGEQGQIMPCGGSVRRGGFLVNGDPLVSNMVVELGGEICPLLSHLPET